MWMGDWDLLEVFDKAGSHCRVAGIVEYCVGQRRGRRSLLKPRPMAFCESMRTTPMSRPRGLLQGPASARWHSLESGSLGRHEDRHDDGWSPRTVWMVEDASAGQGLRWAQSHGGFVTTSDNSRQAMGVLHRRATCFATPSQTWARRQSTDSTQNTRILTESLNHGTSTRRLTVGTTPLMCRAMDSSQTTSPCSRGGPSRPRSSHAFRHGSL